LVGAIVRALALLLSPLLKEDAVLTRSTAIESVVGETSRSEYPVS